MFKTNKADGTQAFSASVRRQERLEGPASLSPLNESRIVARVNDSIAVI